MNIEIAKKIIETLEGVNRTIFGLIPYLEDRCNEEELNNLKREIARVSNGIGCPHIARMLALIL